MEEREGEKDVHKDLAMKAALGDRLESHQDESGIGNISYSTIVSHNYF